MHAAAWKTWGKTLIKLKWELEKFSVVVRDLTVSMSVVAKKTRLRTINEIEDLNNTTS